MTRLFHKYFKSNAQFIVFVLVGFTCGLYYWHSYAKLRCSAIFSRAETSTTDRLFYDHFSYRTGSACRNGTSPIFLTISILSSFERLKLYLPAILETWLLTTDREVEVILFLEENSTTREDWIKSFFSELNRNQPIQACFYIVKLKHVENDYPPQKKSFFAMKYLHTFYRQRTQWLLRLDDNAYVHVEELVHWLKSIDHRRTLYLGQCGFGRKTGPAIQCPPGKVRPTIRSHWISCSVVLVLLHGWRWSDPFTTNADGTRPMARPMLGEWNSDETRGRGIGSMHTESHSHRLFQCLWC